MALEGLAVRLIGRILMKREYFIKDHDMMEMTVMKTGIEVVLLSRYLADRSVVDAMSGVRIQQE